MIMLTVPVFLNLAMFTAVIGSTRTEKWWSSNSKIP
jgi:hypothetical protein